MNAPDPAPTTRARSISPEALIGTGITIAMVGLLFLLLGWAQYMRLVHDAAMILGALGAALALLGVIIWISGAAKQRN